MTTRRGESNFRIEIFANITRGQKDEFGKRLSELVLLIARNTREYFYPKIRFSTPTCETKSALKALAGKYTCLNTIRRYLSSASVETSAETSRGASASMVVEVRGVFGTLTHPRLILLYSAHYGHLASHYGGPWCSPIPWWCNEKHLQVTEPPIYVKMVGLSVLSVLTMRCPHTKPSHTIF